MADAPSRSLASDVASGRATWPDTHGRWPWVAAGAVLPASVIAYRRRATLRCDAEWVFWLAGPALLWHQTEEWVWPGGFLPWFNRSVVGGTDEFPITRGAAFRINVGLGWGLSLASAVTGSAAPAFATVNLGLMGGNAALHISQAIRQRRYNPGLVTATVLFVPFVALGSRRLGSHPDIGRGATASGITIGLIASSGVFSAIRRRAGKMLTDRTGAGAG